MAAAVEAHWNFSASTMFADAMILTISAEDSSWVNSTKDGAGTIVTHTCHGESIRGFEALVSGGSIRHL
jgi:hypothetical protein